MKERVREWIDLAKIDLSAADKLAGDENLTPSAAFHAHQCCEKSFKALIEHLEKPVPKVHDLIRLHQDVMKDMNFSPDEDILDDLSRVYLDSRYPSMIGHAPYGKPTLRDIKRYIAFAAEILEKIVLIVSR